MGLRGLPRRNLRCPIGELLTTLDPVEREALRDALNEPSVSAASIGRLLTAHQHPITGDHVARHRRGICSCSKT